MNRHISVTEAARIKIIAEAGKSDFKSRTTFAKKIPVCATAIGEARLRGVSIAQLTRFLGENYNWLHNVYSGRLSYTTNNYYRIIKMEKKLKEICKITPEKLEAVNWP